MKAVDIDQPTRVDEERYVLVLRVVTEGMYDWSIESGSLWVSDRLIEILGFTDPGLSAADWNARVHPVDFPAYRAAVRDCLRGQTPRLDCEYRVRLDSGVWRWVEDHGLAIRNPSGRAIRLVGGVSDITRRKETEQALRESEERYALAMQAINEAVYEWDIDTGEMYYSPRLHEALGLTPDQLRSRNDWVNRVHPEDLPAYRAALIAHFKGISDRFECEYRYRGPDGSWRWARQHGVAPRDPTGRAHRMVGSTGDITLEKDLARELDRARNQLHDAVSALEEGFALFDAEDRLVIFNSRYARFFRELADVELIPGMTFEMFMRAALVRGMFPMAGGSVDAWLAALLPRRRQGGTREQYLANDTWLRVSDYPAADGSLVSVYTDVTDLKRRQQELEEAKEAAEQSLAQLRAAQQQLVLQHKMASLGQLTAGVAHEIKNPLNFVNNFAGLSVELLDELKGATEPALAALGEAERAAVDETMEVLTGNLEKIAEHGKRADNIVKSMLEHARGLSGERRMIDLNTLIEEAMSLAYHGARAQGHDFDVAIEHDFDRALQPIELVPQDVNRVFLNLFGNGFYAGLQRMQTCRDASFRPMLRVATRDLGDAVEVTVRDNGSGIPPEIKDKVFEPFFTTKPTGEGTGLGLSIAYDIVTQQHGGTIAVNSEVNKYTEFAIRLPRDPQAAGIALRHDSQKLRR